jgi:3-oxoacyl-[acyl-carrier-protein] synthase-1
VPEAAIAVTAVGLRTPVGNDAVQSAAAVRAGINRLALWEAQGVEFDGEAGVFASFLPDDLGDVPWVEKAIDMIPEPIHEALWAGRLFDFVEARRRNPRAQIGAYVATPYPDRAGVEKDAFRLFSVEARQHCIAPARADAVEIFSCDQAAGIVALERAIADLRAGKVDFAVVGAVDSLLHGPYLQSLEREGRLKLPSRADGLIPGEAAGVVVLERWSDARARGAPLLARLGEAAIENEAIPLGPEHPIRGEALGRAVARALERADAPDRVARVIVDLTGERWRSLEWSIVETRCLHGLRHGWQLWHPADCLGDVGAATSIVHLALAVRAFARGYCGNGGILLSAASSRGERAAITVFSAEGSA